jgi:hypothetical protein
MSQTQPDAPLFYLGQDNIAIDELLVLRTGLGIAAETQINASKNTCETGDKNQTKNLFISSQTFHQTTCERVQKTTV